MTDFPRGFTVVGAGSPVTVTLPTVPNVAYVVTDAVFDVQTNAAAVGGFVACYIGSAAVWGYALAITGGAWANYAREFHGELSFPVGAAVTIGFTGVYANAAEQLEVHAYAL